MRQLEIRAWWQAAPILLVGCIGESAATQASFSGADAFAVADDDGLQQQQPADTAAEAVATDGIALPDTSDTSADLDAKDGATTDTAVVDGQPAEIQTADVVAADLQDVDSGPACSVATCPPASACQIATCSASGCGVAAKADGTGCDDGDPCSQGDQCAKGNCQAGADVCAALLPTGVGTSPCKLVGELPKATSIAMVPWFTSLPVSQPIHLTHFPDGSDRMVVVSRPGQINLFANDPSVTSLKLILNIQSKVNPAGEGGLLSVAFHPKFKQNKKFYVNYTSVGVFNTIVSEFTMSAADPEVANPASEKILMTIFQPFTNHNGGQIAFDHDGLLHIGMGDGGSAGDPFNAGQDNQNLLGKMLRIDVDKAENGKNYAIPKNNPFVGNAAYKPEIYATGMRNPWRFSVDRLTGQIWAADVGQNLWEEIDIIEKGKNYGWKVMEGSACFSPKTGCNKAGMALPVAEWPHGVSNSITGGFVYRGSQNPALYGSYVSGDYDTGKYWTTTPDGKGNYVTTEVLDTADHPVTFGEDRDGELYVAQLFPPKIWRIKQQATAPPAGPQLPKKLSETGCFSQLAALTPAPGVVPYELNAPLWSDGAHKRRFLVLPSGAVVKPGTAGPIAIPDDPSQSWGLPVGTLIIKHFALGDAATTPVETRFLRRDASGWSFFTFRWQADGKDADLWLGGGDASYDVVQTGKIVKKTWSMPSQTQCGQCHRGSSDNDLVLGVQSAQLDRSAVWAKGNNQIAVFAKAGLLAKPQLLPKDIAEFADLNALDTQDGSLIASAQAARAYLHSNCAHCHRPGGGSPSDLDLRASVALDKTAACSKVPQAGDLGVTGADIIAPGNAGKSVLYLRLLQTPQSGWQMPSLAVAVPHTAGAKLIGDWIAGLKSCTGP